MVDVRMVDCLRGQPYQHVEQGTDEWRLARRGRVTASEFATICGLSPWCTPQSLWQLATGRIGGDWAGNEHTQHGTAYESTARDAYCRLTGNVVETCGLFIHRGHTWLAASPDGLIGDHGLLEIKCPTRSVHTTVPLAYMCQIQGQLEITDRRFAHFFSWTSTQCSLFEVQRSADFWTWMLPRLQTFYACVEADMEPSTEELGMVEHPNQTLPPVLCTCLGTWP